MDHMKGPQFRTRQAQGDHGVDLDKLRGQLDKLHAIPQLKAGLNGRLSRIAPEVEAKPMSEAQEHEAGVKALAQCVAVAEGDWIDKTIRKVFRDDHIGASYNRRMKAMRSHDMDERVKGIEAMKNLLSEYHIEINHREPEEGYEMPEDCILYRRLEIIRGGVVRGEMVWEWTRDRI